MSSFSVTGKKWILRKSDQKFCVSVGSQVYILHKITRGIVVQLQ